jgi:MbtH protein
MSVTRDGQEMYDVVLNGEEQYSIWRTGREIPAGWRAVGRRGSKEECLTWVDENWTDMRPLSVRAFHAAQG